ncbi:hypothetical protein J1N35_036927 [Gossypium stocksii]|uniref:NB-ARC domain-containing protein n=1 Tax=Gossypium stocksii TaxID=47602 RepID=A0A9D3ZL48_9ROSI|nr:hypothetical protein J1N35_036927 [Gossypium stocksii]
MYRIFRSWTFAKEDCWSLFVKHALGDKDSDEGSTLKKIGKRCFAYCSIFLKGHKFEKGDLIRMWVTEDLVQQLNSRRRMEDAVVTLSSHHSLPTDMKDLTKLKHLDLKGTPLIELLDSIGDLKQLGYLDLPGTEIHCLPEEICSLYNLQTLKLSDCRSLTCLPTNMKNPIKLEHLDMSRTHILQMPPRFDNLKRLQLLTYFVVGNNGVSGISEVKDLSLLGGTFSILRLQYVSQIEHAKMANLKDKKYLRELVLEWDAPCNGNTQNARNNHPNGNMQTVNDLLNCNTENPTVGFSIARPYNGNTHIAENAMDNPQNWNRKSAEDDLHNLCATHASNVLNKLQPDENLENLETNNFFGEFTKLVRECFVLQNGETSS